MSLTSFLKEDYVQKKFAQTFKLPRANLFKGIRVEAITSNYSLVGTAFDYLLRFYIKKHDPKAKERTWVAEEALFRISGTDFFPELEKKYNFAEQIYFKYLEDGIITEDLIKACIFLARMDLIVRAGIIDPNMDVYEKEDIIDLKHLIELVEIDTFMSKNRSALNPTFGEASRLIGGADADLIIDDNLIDIKTTQKIELKPIYYYQLLGYYILSLHSGIDAFKNVPELSKMEIKKLSIYYSRYRYLLVFDAPDMNDPKFKEFYDWFINEIIKYR